VGLRDAEDVAIWDHAMRTGAVIVTKDEDFVARAAHGAGEPPVVVWLRVGNTTNRALLAWMEARLPAMLELLSQGNRLLELI
jgi:predicted nuclease of predicted toxin-antitoxin system